MASKDSLIIREKAAVGTVVQVTTSTPVAIRIRKIGSESATSVTVTTATNIVLVGSTTTDTLAFATYTTVGTLAAAINATGRWECKVLDALLADATTSKFVTGVVTAGTDGNGVVVWDVLADTAALKAITATLSLGRNFDAPKKGHVVELQEAVYYLTLGGAGAGLFRVYQRVNGVETQLLGDASVSASKTTFNIASGVGKITGADGADLIVRVQDGTSIAGTAGDFLRAAGVLK